MPLGTNFLGIVMSLVPSFGSLPSSFALPLPVWGVSGNSSFVNVTFPPVTTFSPLTPGNVTFVPFGTPLTVTSTWPSVGSCVPTVNVGVFVTSRCTTTEISTLTGVSPVRVTVTGILTIFWVSFPVHVIPVGVPVTFPSVPTVNPFVGVAVNVASSLFGLITFSLLIYGWPSTALFVGFFSPAFSTSSTATSTSSLLPSGYATSTVT